MKPAGVELELAAIDVEESMVLRIDGITGETCSSFLSWGCIFTFSATE